MAKNLLLVSTVEDASYLSRFKPLVAGHTVYMWQRPVSTWFEILQYCKGKQVTGIISTSVQLLKKLTGLDKVSIDNYAGSFFVRDGIEIVFIDPLKQLMSVSYGSFVAQRYISKILAPEKWSKFPATRFDWEILTPKVEANYFIVFKSAIAIAIDIETRRDLSISMVSYTGIFFDSLTSQFSTKTLVLPLDSDYEVEIMRKWNWNLTPAKIFQGGDYDNAYFLAYRAPVYNWMWDTMTMQHCWYSELPKDLGTLGAFYIRECVYWKDMGLSPDKYTQMEYCGRDTWGTANVFLQWIMQAPEWARKNYEMEFPLMFPNLLCGMTGIRRDFNRLKLVRADAQRRIAASSVWLDTALGVKNFNTNSPPQMKALLKILGCGDLEDTKEKSLKKAMYRHPLNALILDKVLEIRALRKLLNTYLRTDEDEKKSGEGGAKEYKGRILYAIKGHGTDTGRNASKEHYFWCGVNIQNQPSRPTEYVTGKECKSTYVADDGFLFGEVDLEQAESRDTAYCSGEPTLIKNVTGTRDFHSLNASSFFGLDYQTIYDDVLKKTRNKLVRDLAKRVNHGANYLMGADVLVDTMGLKFLNDARRLLKLPGFWTPKQIAEHLLGGFHKTYPLLEKIYYPAVTHQVMSTKLLVGATGWTRYCFGNPEKNKRDKNSYVAHVSQSLNAMVLNKAFMRVFYELALNEKYNRHFKLNAQIHDSILFQFREGHEYLCELVRERMEIPVTVKSAVGPVYTFTVPASIKAGKTGKGAAYWSETE